jgi:ABC-type oligopeptide transport system ATPase subunit
MFSIQGLEEDNMGVVLDVKNLSMHYETLAGNVSAVKDISFSINSGESFGLVGESGCGKTSVAMTLLQLQPIMDTKKFFCVHYN